MKTSEAGIALIKKFEGLRLKAYPDPGTGGDPWTIGYGTTSLAGVGKVLRGMVISEVQAESLLVRSLAAVEANVLSVLKHTPTQHQFDAMVSLTYNIGFTNFAGSRVVRYFNAGNPARAALAFLAWRKAAGRVLPGLELRRKAERDLFLKP